MCIGSGLFGLFCDPIDAHTNLSLPLTAGFLTYILLHVAIAYAKNHRTARQLNVTLASHAEIVKLL